MFENLFEKTPHMKHLIESLEADALKTKLIKILDIFEVPEDAMWLVETRLGDLNFIKCIDGKFLFKRTNTAYKWTRANSSLVQSIKRDIEHRSIEIPKKITLSDKLRKEDEVNFVLWGKKDSVTIIRHEYPELYKRVIDNLSNHMCIIQTGTVLTMTCKD